MDGNCGPDNLIDVLEKAINESSDLASSSCTKSLIAFEEIKTKLIVDNILEELVSPNENILYAKLIMSPKNYKALWQDNIKNLSLENIHMANQFLKNAKTQILPQSILDSEELNTYIEINSKIASNWFKKSLKGFDNMRENLRINNKIEEEVGTNVNIIYAKILMSPELYEVLWEENITKMSLERIYIINRNLTVKNIQLIPSRILIDESIPIDSIDAYLVILWKLKENLNEELVDILKNTYWTQDAWLENNLLFAKILLSPEKYQIIWEENLENENISPEIMYAIEDNLNIEVITALKWINLTHNNMSVNKIVLIGQMLSADEILKFGFEKWQLMIKWESEETLNSSDQIWPANKPPTFWAERIAEMTISELQMELYT